MDDDVRTTTTEPGAEEPPRDRFQRRPQRPVVGRTIFGMILIALGAQALVETLSGRDVHLVLLAIGLALLGGWWALRNYGLLVGGGLVSGVGLGHFFESLFPEVAIPFTLLSLSAGFAFIGMMSGRRRGTWAFITAGILAAVALLDLGALLSLPLQLADALLPLALIAVGVVLLLRTSLPTRAVQWLLAGLVALLVISLLSGSQRLTLSPFGMFGADVASQKRSVSLPSGIGRIELEAGAGDVDVDHGDEVSVSALIEARGISRKHAREALERAEVITSRSGSTVELSLRRDGGNVRASYSLIVPDDVDLVIRTSSGDVSGAPGGSRADFTSASGDIHLDLSDSSSGRVSIRTGSGDVDLLTDEDVEVSARTGSGDIDVEEGSNEASFSKQYRREGSGLELQIQTGSGDIQIKIPA